MRIKVKANDGTTHIEVKTFYDKGGINVFTGVNDRRGYYISCCPIEVGEHTVRQVLFAGAKKFIQPCGRLNRKTLESLQEKTLENAGDLIEHVCKEYGLVIDEEVA